ncbi:hypothetical protein L7F22_062349 [Adiantum nelumboides]|nr:hypothetical protein [Adiantum nelumboides]
MKAWFLSGFNSRKLRVQEVPASTKKFTKLVHRALKLEQQVKKEKSRHRGSFDTSTSETIETEKSSSSSSESSEDDRKKKKKGSWSKKIDDMSKRIFEIFGLRGSAEKIEKWCTKCKAKNHTMEECTQCNYHKAFGHEWTNCKIRIHHLKEGKDLSMITFANMEPVAAIIEQPQTASTNTNGYNGRGRGAQCPEPNKPVVPEAKPEPVPIRAITRSSRVVIGELLGDEPTSSKLNPKAKEWEQSRSTWKEKGKAKELGMECIRVVEKEQAQKQKRKLQGLHDRLKPLLDLVLAGRGNVQVCREIEGIRGALLDIAKLEVAKHRHKCRIRELPDSNDTSKGFYNKLKSKHRREGFHTLSAEDGLETTDCQQIMQASVEYFEKILNVTKDESLGRQKAIEVMLETVDNSISGSDAQRMEAPFTKNEVHFALKKMGSDKTPGYCGLSKEFLMASNKNIAKCMSYIELFSLAAGMNLNVRKSQLIDINADESML